MQSVLVYAIRNSPFHDYAQPDEHASATYDMTPGFKPFTVFNFK